MESKKRDSNLVAVLVAIFALIVLSIWYHYLGDYTIKKVDAALGVDSSLKINDIVIEKGYSNVGGLEFPEVKISYSTSRTAESYIMVNNVKSEVSVSRSFSKTISLSRDFFGKSVEISVYAKDSDGNEAAVFRTVSLPSNIEPVIAIIST